MNTIQIQLTNEELTNLEKFLEKFQSDDDTDIEKRVWQKVILGIKKYHENNKIRNKNLEMDLNWDKYRNSMSEKGRAEYQDYKNRH